MFDWFKPKAKKASSTTPVPAQKQNPATRREDLIREANANAKMARDAIGQDTLDKLVRAIQKKHEIDTTSPAAQARKILEQMDKGHMADFLKALHDETPTKH